MPPHKLPSGLGPESPRAEAAQRLISSRLAAVNHTREALGQTFSEKGVHELRVATRRLRAALKVFRSLGALRRLEQGVKRLQDALGQVRDVHVQAQWLSDEARGAKTSKRTALEALRAGVEAPLATREQGLRRALDAWKKRTEPALRRELERLKGPGRYGGRRVREQLLHRLRQVKRLMKVYQGAPDPLVAHELRKSVKKLRYEAELFHAALPQEMAKVLKVLKPLQEGLGALHDADVRLGLLEGFATRGASAERTAAQGLLEHVREERARCAHHTDKALVHWHEHKQTRKLRALLKS